MDHYRLRKYRGPKVWAKVREAYLAGETGPSCAKRFDVSLANLRKKALREGWTRNREADRLDDELPVEAVAPDREMDADDAPINRRAALDACLDHAAVAMARGESQKALTALKAALAYADLSGKLGKVDDPDGMRRGREAALAFLRARGELG